ncbi:LLM class flavin-dependent oxidoreductase [Streptomyces roseirectus]|uniref:LLM class flavin-dependent oxidoreductase n=1 Tax=Streptomyces roseirectus TaxID=2768066 RepID=A0A7H0IQX7_9ACTN|nr:LLM class flavin-dependent oxidoreductase [Streptomyces roseirectus]QNP75193.1 LLM class flavin-dependent oxidoreductase [Streptomyces roseirectus]
MADRPTASVLFPVQPKGLGRIAAFAALVHEGHARRLWVGQSMGALETHQVLAALTVRFPGISLGTGVTVTPLRHPYEAALHARSLAALSGAPFVAGYGPSYPSFQRAVLPSAYRSPRSAMEAYLHAARALLEGRTVHHDSDAFTLHGSLEPLRAPPVEFGLGVLRPAMAHTAGRAADVAITLMTPQRYVHEALVPALRAGAEEARRARPRIATMIHFAVSRPGRNLERLTHAGAWPNLTLPHYADMFRRAGIDVDPNDPAEGARRLLRSGGIVVGTPSDIASALQEYRDCGVDEVVLNPAGVLITEGVDAAVQDLREVLAADRA